MKYYNGSVTHNNTVGSKSQRTVKIPLFCSGLIFFCCCCLFVLLFFIIIIKVTTAFEEKLNLKLHTFQNGLVFGLLTWTPSEENLVFFTYELNIVSAKKI